MEDIYKHEPLWGVWKIDSFIGKGNYGKVYKIYREESGRKIYAAAKIISVPKEQSEIQEARRNRLAMDDSSIKIFFEERANKFLQEIDMMAILEGESNIVNYESHVKIEKKDMLGWDIIIRMELLTALGLYTEDNAITKKDVVRLGIDICNAIKSCQSKNIIHRDIKVENIFVSDEKKFKLGDLGVAREVDGTTTGTKIGTENYMAPEVFNGKYNNSADIYSLGIVMYRLLNDMKMPFYNDDYEEAYKKRIIDGEPFPKPRFGEDKLLDIVLKACAFNKSDRYSNPDEMISDLLEIQNNIEDMVVLEPLQSSEDRGTLGDIFAKVTMDSMDDISDRTSEGTIRDINGTIDRGDFEEGTISDINDIAVMPKNKKKIFFVTSMLIFFISFSAYYYLKTRPVLVSEIIGLPYRVHLVEHDTYQINLKLLPEGATGEVMFSSLDTEIAVIDNDGLIVTKNVGNTIITVTADDVSKIIDLTVVAQRIPVEDIAGVPAEAELIIGHSMTINGKALPETATDAIIVYTSSNPNIASVSNEGIVNALSVGRTIISVSSGDIIKNMIIDVNAEPVKIPPSVPKKPVVPDVPIEKPVEEEKEPEPSQKPYTDPNDANGFI